MSLPSPPPVPCGSCPYRCDVPSGIWEADEYDKLPAYDGETFEQPLALFMCHQRDGRLCGGWLACHDKDHLLALRFTQVDPSAYAYTTDVPVFASGAAAREHGLRDIDNPGPRALALMAGITKMKDKL